SIAARQTLASILIGSGALQDVRPHLEVLLAADPERTGQVFLQMNAMLARHADKAAVAQLVNDLAALYPKLPEAHLAVAQAHWNAKQPEAALKAAARAPELKPDWERAALFRTQMLQRGAPEEAIRFAREYVRAHPGAKDMRMNLARMLAVERRNDEARSHIEALVAANPN